MSTMLSGKVETMFEISSNTSSSTSVLLIVNSIAVLLISLNEDFFDYKPLLYLLSRYVISSKLSFLWP